MHRERRQNSWRALIASIAFLQNDDGDDEERIAMDPDTILSHVAFTTSGSLVDCVDSESSLVHFFY